MNFEQARASHAERLCARTQAERHFILLFVTVVVIR
jgi:hypothetical protein